MRISLVKLGCLFLATVVGVAVVLPVIVLALAVVAGESAGIKLVFFFFFFAGEGICGGANLAARRMGRARMVEKRIFVFGRMEGWNKKYKRTGGLSEDGSDDWILKMELLLDDGD